MHPRSVFCEEAFHYDSQLESCLSGSPKAGSPPAAAVYRDDYATNFSRSLAYRPPEALQMKREIKEMKPKLDSASKALDRTNSVVSISPFSTDARNPTCSTRSVAAEDAGAAAPARGA